jgi:hypothetical protein
MKLKNTDFRAKLVRTPQGDMTIPPEGEIEFKGRLDADYIAHLAACGVIETGRGLFGGPKPGKDAGDSAADSNPAA